MNMNLRDIIRSLKFNKGTKIIIRYKDKAVEVSTNQLAEKVIKDLTDDCGAACGTHRGENTYSG